MDIAIVCIEGVYYARKVSKVTNKVTLYTETDIAGMLKTESERLTAYFDKENVTASLRCKIRVLQWQKILDLLIDAKQAVA